MGKVTIKLTAISDHPECKGWIGDVISVAPHAAKYLVDRGGAVYVDGPPKQAIVSEEPAVEPEQPTTNRWGWRRGDNAVN